MGRKGVSKRKPSQTKSKPFAGGNNASGSVSSAMQAAEPQQVKSFDPGKADSSGKGSGKTSSESKKKNKKG
jgi:hypothetical protein